MVTWAPSPSAIRAACVPTTPPPIMVTLPLGTPGTPPRSTPEPPSCLVKKWAPICTAMRPATSLIGTKSGKWHS